MSTTIDKLTNEVERVVGKPFTTTLKFDSKKIYIYTFPIIFVLLLVTRPSYVYRKTGTETKLCLGKLLLFATLFSCLVIGGYIYGHKYHLW